MRRTGRTSRIVNYVVTQLFEVGQCISTDHIVFEFEKTPDKRLYYFINKVEKHIDFLTNGRNSVKSKITKIDIDGEYFKVIYFKLINKNE